RHPSQLYEAGMEGIFLFLILWLLATKTRVRNRGGILSGVFLCGYALFRCIAEFFREPDDQLGLFFDTLSMGQLLSMPMFVVGILLIIYAKPIPRDLTVKTH
ncbi:MAG: prolipoprotein diacylglyceryl transferase, partial [Rickettsiales bacterium]|nr:prolipoprotein diacylglyceryl transferase [Rickettsiales bacterium]